MATLDVEQYRALAEHDSTMVWRTVIDGRRDYFNANWIAFTGRALEEELGNGWVEGIHADDLAFCSASRLEHLELRQPFEMEFRLRRFDGAYRYVSDRGVPYVTNGSFGGFIGRCVDVDDRRSHEASSSENDFFGMSLDNLCVAGFDGYFKRVNLSWTRTLGWTAEELMSKPSIHFVHPDDREATMAGRGRLLEGALLGPLINRYLCRDGTYRWFEWRSVGHPERGLVYAAARDITEQKLAEARLAEAKELQEKLQRQLIFADRMASVGTLAAGVAHELNNPLAYVSGNIALILEELETLGGPSSAQMTELKDMALQAQAGSERIRKIVLGLKTFSRVEEERRVAIDLQPVLELAIGMAYHEIRHRARLVREYGETPLVDADDARLGQVFINLLVNAAQSLPEGDHLTHEIRIVTWTDAAGRAVIEVRDTGSGIPAAVIDRVFDPFFTTKPVGVGTGLGLFICHNIVLGLGGEITATSPEGRGTTIRIVLPAALAPPAGAAISARPSGTSSTGAAVLVVDDEPAIGIVLRRVLRDHEVTVVTGARHALALIRAGQQHFDVILSDLMMPEMSGMAFYEELTQLFPEVVERVVFISGGAFTPTTKAFLDRIPNEIISKPFDPEMVRETVKRMSENCKRSAE